MLTARETFVLEVESWRTEWIEAGRDLLFGFRGRNKKLEVS